MMSRPLDPRTTNPFPLYDAEVRRISRHLSRLDPAGWKAASHCAGWSVKDLVAHLAHDEEYNQACLDRELHRLKFSGGLDAWNARGVRARQRLAPAEVLAEWTRRQTDVRQRWGKIGLGGKIQTSIGPYSLRLQVWHLAREYAIHGDDLRVPVPARERARQLYWRSAFGLFAAEEEGDSVPAQLVDGKARLQRRGRVLGLDLATFVAYLTDRPQHLNDPAKRTLVRRLLQD